MQLRWYSTKRNVTTADITAHMETRQLSRVQAKCELERKTALVLQMFDGWDWRDVPTVHEVIDRESGNVRFRMVDGKPEPIDKEGA